MLMGYLFFVCGPWVFWRQGGHDDLRLNEGTCTFLEICYIHV